MKIQLLNGITLGQRKTDYLLYKCPEEHRFQAAGNERKKEIILIERMKERKQEKEKERKKERKKEERKKERKIPANCRVDQLLVTYSYVALRNTLKST